MKLCRFGPRGAEKPGLFDHAGKLRDLSEVIPDLGPAELSPASLDRLRSLNATSLPEVDGDVRLGVPVARIPQIVAIGLNYEDHAVEANLPIPTEPATFLKSVSSLNGPYDEVMLPKDSEHSDWELELGVVIGKTARYVTEAQAPSHVAGYCVVNDLSERFNQKQRGSQWSKGKSADTFCPVGPWLVTADEIANPNALAMYLYLNGVRRQAGNTRTMIFDVPEIVSYVSRFITLHPGDLVITGTPPGVGEGMKPDPIFLKAGDELRFGIEKLGEQTHKVVGWRHIEPEDRP
ncbi:MAG: fumarylacetoacetate hydrolase family protein [Proteobacteria bacterium]|nr:fumarylacetoacetate hydrolase family protein [Pseudomonadota bacterium]